MARISVFTDQAPKAIGPYSQAVRAGNTVYLSGQIPLDPKTGELVKGDIQQEARRAFDNLKAVAAAAGDGPAFDARAIETQQVLVAGWIRNGDQVDWRR